MTEAEVLHMIKLALGERLIRAGEFLTERIKENIGIQPDQVIVEGPNPNKYPLNPTSVHVWGYPPSAEGDYPQVASGDLQRSIKYQYDFATSTVSIGIDPLEPKFAHEQEYWTELELVTNRTFMLRSALESLPELVGILANDPAYAVNP